MVETHEDVHVRDIEIAVNAVLRSWDAKLNEFRHTGRRFLGADQATAIARLDEAAGGTPTEIGARFASMLKRSGHLFHMMPGGEMPGVVRMVQDGPTLEVSIQHSEGLAGLHQQRLAAEVKRDPR